MKKIPLTKGQFALIDDEDLEKVKKYKWYLVIYHGIKYAFSSAFNFEKQERRPFSLHEFLLGKTEKGFVIDHKDGDGLNNQKNNLRFSTYSQNLFNQKKRKDNTSGYKGVSKDNNKKLKNIFKARIHFNHKEIWLGRFRTAENAARIYDKAAKEYYGEFARLNFPKNPRI